MPKCSKFRIRREVAEPCINFSFGFIHAHTALGSNSRDNPTMDVIVETFVHLMEEVRCKGLINIGVNVSLGKRSRVMVTPLL